MGKRTSLMSEIWQRLDAIGVVCGAITCKKVITNEWVRYKITWSRYVTLDLLVS